jgi:hypothetical protein
MKPHYLLLALTLLTSAACHPGPVIAGGPKPQVGGTIAGIVLTDAKVPVAGRKVTVIDTQSGMRYDATTGVNGGYTVKVPQGAYRIEVELQAGEVVAKQPAETRINNSDLDSGRDFVIASKPAGR